MEYSDYQAFIEPIRQRMVNSIWRIVRHPEETEDVLQDALVKIVGRIHKVRAHPNPTALILRMCFQCAIDHVRKKRVRPAALEAVDDWNAGMSPRSILQHQELQQRVLHELGRLPTRESEALFLLVLEECNYPEIAQAMGCSESTARVLVHKGRQRLKKIFLPDNLKLAGNSPETER